jgi:hypothetical protein
MKVRVRVGGVRVKVRVKKNRNEKCLPHKIIPRTNAYI